VCFAASPYGLGGQGVAVRMRLFFYLVDQAGLAPVLKAASQEGIG